MENNFPDEARPLWVASSTTSDDENLSEGSGSSDAASPSDKAGQAQPDRTPQLLPGQQQPQQFLSSSLGAASSGSHHIIYGVPDFDMSSSHSHSSRSNASLERRQQKQLHDAKSFVTFESEPASADSSPESAEETKAKLREEAPSRAPAVVCRLHRPWNRQLPTMWALLEAWLMFPRGEMFLLPLMFSRGCSLGACPQAIPWQVSGA
mmetsp:Transcript_64438/g.153751  ORF Transcript_64438/g.153751 Transcript_64438/m.153751 type:complete len:207 (+) Transcript_64438:61-681(+)